jgi:CubicO group peptidase (beta-lactamase class C family)
MLALVAAPPAAAQTAPPAGLDAYIEKAMREWNVPGLGVAIVKNDSVVLAKGYGVREAGKPTPADANTIFAIGSNTKAFTGAAIGMLVDEGKMRWDDPVTRYLPTFQLHDPYVTREITIRDVLSHRSGLGRRADLLWYGSPFDRTEVLRRIRHLVPNSSFRSQYGYQNVMYLAAGEASAAAAGSSWDDLIKERILRPLGMNESSTSVAGLPAGGNVATPHLQLDGRATPTPWRNIDNAAPAGSINSSAAEMTRWVRMQLAGGAFGGKQLLRPRTHAETWTPQTILPSPSDTLFPSTHFTTYGLGWVLQDYLGRKQIWHTGGIDGMLSEVRLVPEEKLGIVVLSNSEGHNMNSAIVYRILDAYLGAPERDWSAVFLARYKASLARQDSVQKARLAARVKGTKPSLPLAGYAGTYTDSLYGETKLALENGRLVLTFGTAFTGELEHWHHDTFRITWRDRRMGSGFVTFALGATGKVARMDVEGITTFHPAASPARPAVATR